jgi:hypothetical protein
MTMKKVLWAVADVLGAVALCWFLYDRATGVPMAPADWLLIGYIAGAITMAITPARCAA